MKTWLRAAIISVPMLAVSSADCTFLNKPEEFLSKPDQRWQEISGWTAKVAPSRAAADITPIPRKNFIDDYIFGRMERDGIQPAPISTDPEFLRRVYLDLTGRIPSADQVRSFITDTDPEKRAALVDSLIGSPEFVENDFRFQKSSSRLIEELFCGATQVVVRIRQFTNLAGGDYDKYNLDSKRSAPGLWRPPGRST